MSMSKYITITFLTLTAITSVAFAASCQNDKIMNLSTIAVNPDCRPEFPGGEEAMQKYIHSHFAMPSWCQDGDIQGTVKVAFVVSATGQVTQAVITKSLDPDIDAEALRVVRSLPKFHPATINGKPVDCLQSTTILIRISD